MMRHPPTLPGISAMLSGVPVSPESEHTYLPQQEVRSTSFNSRHLLPAFHPESKGWFRVEQDEVQRAMDMIVRQGYTTDQLYEAVFAVKDDRLLFVPDKPDLGKEEALLNEPPKTEYSLTEKKHRSNAKHSLVEKRRRIRHALWQQTGHGMTSEIAHLAVETDPAYVIGKQSEEPKSDKRTKSNKVSTKAPGKDEQFCSNIYNITFLGLALQSEHTSRQLAEERAAAAERRAERLERQLRKRSFEEEDDFTSTSHHSWSPHKRRMLHSSGRLPPSPSLTASMSRSPTPPSSASPSFSH